MSSLQLSPGELTPAVNLIPEKGIFRIEGKSLMDNPGAFYKAVKDWFQSYLTKPNPNTHLEIKFEYYNTATARELLEIFAVLEKIEHSKIIWHFLEDDEDMEESGQEFAHLTKVPFEFRPY